MRIIAVCPFACESAASRELISLGCTDVASGLGFVTAQTSDVWSLLRYAQTVSHVLLDAGSAEPVLDPAHESFLRDASSFRATSIIGSREDERRIGGVLAERYGVRVDLTDPEIEVGIVADRLGFLLSGFDYSLREYKVYKTPRSLNPCVAASIIWGLDIPADCVMCDPLAHDGVIPIEFALRSFAVSPRRFQERTLASRFASRFDDPKTVREPVDATILALDENANYLRRAEHNARLAGVADRITFSRYDLAWVDFRVEERSVDRLVLEIPHRSAKIDEASYARIIAEAGVGAKRLLARGGELIAITNDPLIGFEGFRIDRRMIVPRGELVLYAIVFRRA